jgi:hypothetical protein
MNSMKSLWAKFLNTDTGACMLRVIFCMLCDCNQTLLKLLAALRHNV